MRLLVLAAVLLTSALVAAAPASAGTVCMVGGTAVFAAADMAADCGAANAASEVNKLAVTADAAGDVVFTDASTPITDGDGPGGCTVAAKTATCPDATAFRFDLGGDDD